MFRISEGVGIFEDVRGSLRLNKSAMCVCVCVCVFPFFWGGGRGGGGRV